MAETLGRGPFVGVGSIMDGRVESLDGPGIEYQGDMIPDARYSPANKDSLSPGAIKGFFNNPYFTLVDGIPSITTTTSVAANQAISTTAGVALNLATAQVGTAAGVWVPAPGVPILPFGATAVVTTLALDFGFQTGTTAANSSTVVVVDNTQFQLGQWLCIPGAGSAGNTNTPLFCQVASLSTNTTVLTITPNALTALSNNPIGQAALYNPFVPAGSNAFAGPAPVVPTAVEPYKVAGFGLAFDPLQGAARGLNIAATSIGSGTTSVSITGYDIYGNLMHEQLTANGTTVVNGKKAWKYVLSVQTLTAATTGVPANISIGHSDIFGINVRSDKWEYLNIFWNGGFAINNTGWTKALSTTSGATTADIRGTVNLSTALTGTGVLSSTNGSARVTIMMSVPLNNMVNCTPLNYSSLFGNPQF